VRLHVRAPASVDVDVQLASGGADLSLGPAPDAGSTGLVIRALGKVELAVLARRDHPAIRGGAIDVDGWLAHPHVRIRTGEAPSLIDKAIEAAGRARHVGFVAPSFLVAPFVVSRTDMFFTAPRALTVGLARMLDLVMLEPPIRIAPIPVALAWHERSHHDEGHRWLRARVAAVAQRVLREGLALTGQPATSEDRAPPERRGRSARARR
jgi:DNA-binding transcriptional LysR family regulator